MTIVEVLSQLNEGTTLEGPHWTEPVKVLTAKARGTRIEIQAVGLHTKRLWNKLLKAEEFDGAIKITPAGELAAFNGNPTHFRLAAEAHRIRLAFQYDPHFAVSVSQVDPLPRQMDAVCSHLLTERRFGKIGQSYAKITFDKEQSQGYSEIEFVGPGHPLFEGVVERVLREYGGSLRQGAVFYNADATDATVLWLLKCAVEDGRGQTIGERLVAVHCTDNRFRKSQPYALLDLKPPDRAVEVAPGVRQVATNEDIVIDWSLDEVTPEYFAEINDRRSRELGIKEKYVRKSLQHLISESKVTGKGRQRRLEPQRAQRAQRRSRMAHEPIPAGDEEIAHKIIGAAIEVHRILGPGFLESIYQKALEYELISRGLTVEHEKPLLVPYKDIEIPGQRVDLLVGGRVIVELKAVEAISPVHQAKLLSYLKATSLRLGLIINFNVLVLKDGIKRMVR